MEAQRSHRQPFANWRTRKAGGVSPSLKAGEPGAPMCGARGRRMSQLEKGEHKLPFLCPFALFRPSVDWMRPACSGEDDLLYSTDSSANLFQKHPPRHSHKECSPALWATLSPIKLTHKINHYTHISGLALHRAYPV